MSMRYFRVLCWCLPSLVAAGCDRPGQREALVTNNPAGGGTAATQAVETVPGQPDPFITAADRRLKDLDSKIEALEKKVQTLSANAKEEADKALSALREKRAQVAPRIEQLKKSGQQAWEEVKTGAETAMNELEKAYESTKAKLGL